MPSTTTEEASCTDQCYSEFEKCIDQCNGNKECQSLCQDNNMACLVCCYGVCESTSAISTTTSTRTSTTTTTSTSTITTTTSTTSTTTLSTKSTTTLSPADCLDNCYEALAECNINCKNAKSCQTDCQTELMQCMNICNGQTTKPTFSTATSLTTGSDSSTSSPGHTTRTWSSTSTTIIPTTTTKRTLPTTTQDPVECYKECNELYWDCVSDCTTVLGSTKDLCNTQCNNQILECNLCCSDPGNCSTTQGPPITTTTDSPTPTMITTTSETSTTEKDTAPCQNECYKNFFECIAGCESDCDDDKCSEECSAGCSSFQFECLQNCHRI